MYVYLEKNFKTEIKIEMHKPVAPQPEGNFMSNLITNRRCSMFTIAEFSA